MDIPLVPGAPAYFFPFFFWCALWRGSLYKALLLNESPGNISPANACAVLSFFFSFLSTVDWVHLSICAVKTGAVFLERHLIDWCYSLARSFLSALILFLRQMTPSAPIGSMVTEESSISYQTQYAVVPGWWKRGLLGASEKGNEKKRLQSGYWKQTDAHSYIMHTIGHALCLHIYSTYRLLHLQPTAHLF